MCRQRGGLLFGVIVAFSVAVAWAEDSPTAEPSAVDPIPSSPSELAHVEATNCPVATIDLGKIFQECRDFKTRYDELRTEIDRASDELSKQSAEQQDREAKLAASPSDDPDHDELAKQVAVHGADLQVALEREKADFAEREAAIYRDTFLKIKDATARYAIANDVRLVLHFSESDHDETPDGLKRNLMQFILYQRGVDITDEILRALNGRSQAALPAASPASEDGACSQSCDEALPIATLDLTRAVDESGAFQRHMQRLSADAQAAIKALQEQQAQLVEALAQRHKKGRVGNVVDGEAVTKLRDGQLAIEGYQQEAEVYLAAYREIQRVVADVAAEKKLALVLQFRGEKHDLDTAEGLKAELTQLILYQRGIDITDEVIDRVARDSKNTP